MARESQGLQIALIIFVLLTVGLGVGTFYFFKQFDETQIKTKTAEAEKVKSDQEAKRLQDEVNELKRLIGFADTEKLDAVTQAAAQDMETYAKTYPEPNKAYRKVLEYLAGQLKLRTDDVAAAKTDNEALKRKLEEREKLKEPQLTQFRDQAKKTSEDLLAATGRFAEATDAMTKDKAELAAQLDAAKKKGAAEATKLSAQVASVARQVRDARKEAIDVNHKYQKVTAINFTSPNGAIRWVDQAKRMAWIDLGRADHLNLQTSFSVYPSDSSDMKKAAKKGSIEVTQILGDHLAEARIVEDELNDPILPGDKIHTPIWSPGDQRHFAVAGMVDVDGDGSSDQQYVLNLIRMNGGVIDAYVDETAKDRPVVGKITTVTRYLVLGTAPTDSKGDSHNTKNYTAMVGAADAAGVEQITAAQLLEMMGNPSGPKVVRYGAGASSKDFKATLPDGVQRKSSGAVTELFKPRRPAAGSAY